MSKESFMQLLTDPENQPHQYVDRPDDLAADMSAKSFEEAVRPLMEYLGKNHHPHTMAIVDNGNAQLVEGLESFNTKEYIQP